MEKMKNNYTIDFSLPLKSGGRVDYMKIRPKPNRVKPNMQDIEKEIKKIIMTGLPKGNVTAVINDLLTLITKIRIKDIEEVRKEIPKKAKDEDCERLLCGHRAYNFCLKEILVYLDSKIERLGE